MHASLRCGLRQSRRFSAHTIHTACFTVPGRPAPACPGSFCQVYAQLVLAGLTHYVPCKTALAETVRLHVYNVTWARIDGTVRVRKCHQFASAEEATRNMQRQGWHCVPLPKQLGPNRFVVVGQTVKTPSWKELYLNMNRDLLSRILQFYNVASQGPPVCQSTSQLCFRHSRIRNIIVSYYASELPE